MLYIAPALQAKLDAGLIARVEMVMFDLPSPTGQKGFFSGEGSFSYGGVTFNGAGSLFEIDTVGAAVDGTAVGLKIRLNGDAREGLEANDLSVIESINYSGRPVYMWRRYMDPDTYAEIDTILIYRGYIDTLEHNVSEGGSVFMEALCESRGLDLGRSGYRKRTDADQRLIDSNDGSLRRVGTIAKKELKWSNLQWSPPAKKKGFFG